MAPMPQEKPETTGAGVLAMWRPSLRLEKHIMKMDATIETLAAPPRPWRSKAAAIKGTVTLDTPPMRTGLRPMTARTGAVRIDV